MSPLPPPQPLALADLFGAPGVLLLVVALALVVSVALRPRLFWPLLIVVNILGNGPKVKGYVILDEVLTASLLAGALVYLSVRRGERAPRTTVDRVHRGAYVLWLCWMLYASWAGILANEDVRLVRWIVFVAIIGVLSTIAFNREEFAFPTHRNVALLITATAIVYYAAYLSQGVASEIAFGPGGRFLTQDHYWSGSAAAVFPTLLAVPAAVFLKLDHSLRARALAWGSMLIMMIAGAYFLSRMLWLALIGLVALSWRRVKPRRIAVLGMLSLVSFFYLPPAVRMQFGPFFGDLLTTAQAPWNLQTNDARSRFLQAEAGISAVLEDPKVFLVGAGLYSHRTLIVPHVRRLLYEYPEWSDFAVAGDDESTVIRTIGFSALLIDTGVIGIGLFLANVGLLVKRIVRKKSANRTLMVSVALLAVLWLFVTNITDMVMLYLLLMPRGLAERWSEHDAIRTESAPERARTGAFARVS